MSTEKASFRELIKNTSFFKLWMAQFSCQLADRIFVYLLIYFAYHFTKSNLGSSLPMLTYGLPALLFSLIFGVIVDRLQKKKILFYSNLFRAIIIAFLAMPTDANYLLPLFGFSFVIFTISQLFNPAELSAIARIVEKKNLILANSLFMVTWMLASILGFGVAAPLLNILGPQGVYTSLIFLYSFAAFLVLLIPFSEQKIIANKLNLSRLRRELRAGVRFVLKHRIVFFALVQMAFSVSIVAILSGVSIGYVDKVLGKPEGDFGYLVAISGIGMMLGVSLISKLLKRFSIMQIIFIGFNIVGLMLLALSLSTNLIAALTIVFVMGMGNALISAPLQTIIQQRTPKSIHGRVFAIQNMVSSFSFTLPPIIAAWLADSYGHTVVFGLLGLIALCLNFWIKKLEK